MTRPLSGKTAIVTGGSRGIGAAIARRLALDGADVAITFHSNEAAARAVVDAIEANGARGLAIQADAAGDKAADDYVAATLDAFGRLDILVHNAGIAVFAPITELGIEDFRKTFAVNVEGVFSGTRAAVAHLEDDGRIIVIGSVNAHAMPTAGGSVYGASKAAVAGFVRGWARDLGHRRILVNAIQPGPVDTELNPADGAMAGVLTPMTALGRYGRPDEIAALTAFLASPESSYITGATIDIDGGMTI